MCYDIFTFYEQLHGSDIYLMPELHKSVYSYLFKLQEWCAFRSFIFAYFNIFPHIELGKTKKKKNSSFHFLYEK